MRNPPALECDRERGAQLAPAGEAEVQGGANPLGGQGQAVTGGVTGEEHAVLDGRAQLVGDPVALIAVGRQALIAGQPDGWLLDMVLWPERADADAQLIMRGEAPGVARADVAMVDPQLHLLAGPGGVDLETARQRGVRG